MKRQNVRHTEESLTGGWLDDSIVLAIVAMTAIFVWVSVSRQSSLSGVSQ